MSRSANGFLRFGAPVRSRKSEVALLSVSPVKNTKRAARAGSSRPQAREGLEAVDRRVHLVAVAAQQLAHHVADLDLVVHDQDAPARTDRSLVDDRLRGDGAADRQLDAECRTPAESAVEGDVAATMPLQIDSPSRCPGRSAWS
jgi:hypothetical protein